MYHESWRGHRCARVVWNPEVDGVFCDIEFNLGSLETKSNNDFGSLEN